MALEANFCRVQLDRPGPGGVDQIDRRQCRQWVEEQASKAVLAERLEQWLQAGLLRKER